MVKVDRFQVGSRWVESGHTIRVLPSREGKKDGFEARVLSAIERDDGTIEVTVFGSRGSKAPSTRTYLLGRLKAMRQPKEARPK